jgi:hypothetical protein
MSYGVLLCVTDGFLCCSKGTRYKSFRIAILDNEVHRINGFNGLICWRGWVYSLILFIRCTIHLKEHIQMNQSMTVNDIFSQACQLTATEQAQLMIRLLLHQTSQKTVKTNPSSSENTLAELQSLGKKIAQGWPNGVSSAEVLSEMRR